MQTTRRWLAAAPAAALLAVALWRFPSAAGGQSAVSWSRPGQEDLSFWVNHNGLGEIDVEGEVGFGDMARLLMRRRSNAGRMRALRERFVFRVREFAALDTPDLFRVQLRDGGAEWLQAPARVVVTAGRIFNLPLVVLNGEQSGALIEARLGASTAGAKVDPKAAAGIFLKVRETTPGEVLRRLSLRVAGREISTEVTFDVRPLATLRVHVIDDRGRPAAARIYLTAADGLGYAPRGAINRFASEPAEQYFHAAGTFEIELPTGETLVEATGGLEYRLLRRSVELRPGETAEVRLALERWEHMAAQGRYSADAHIHANYTAEHHQVITPADVRLQTLAEDLNFANMMVANSSGGFLHDTAYFEGRPHALSRPDHIIYWNEEMRNGGLYGHMCFFNLKSLVYPLYTGFRDTPHWEDWPPNFTQAEAARKQGGAVTYAHPGYAPNLDGASARELPIDLALGQVDAMDVLSNNPEEVGQELWYGLLNCGFRLAVSAGTDAFTNVADHYTPGGGRVYVHIDGPMDSDNWTRNFKRGRSFASNGPMLWLQVEGREPGDEIRLPAGGPRRVTVRGRVRSQVPLDRVEVVVNGRPVVARTSWEGPFEEQITLEGSSWIALRAGGPWHRLILNDARAWAHTSPVYVTFGDRRVALREDVRFYIDWIERLMERLDQRGRFGNAERKAEVMRLFARALAVYRGIEASGGLLAEGAGVGGSAIVAE